MSGRKLVTGLLGLALVLGCTTSIGAQVQKPAYSLEEFNAWQATTHPTDPAERAAEIEAFLKNYPQSVLRAFVYPAYVQLAWGQKDYAAVMKAVDGFIGMDREQVAEIYKQSNYNDTQIDGTYYQGLMLYTYSFLQSFRNGTPNADAAAARAADRARQGLKLHEELYSQVQPPTDPAQRDQFEQTKQQEEAAFRNVLAFTAWRKKDYAAAEREYDVLVNFTPEDPNMNYRLGLAELQLPQPEYEHGFWHLARAVALNVPKKDEVKDYLTKGIAAHQQVLPECIAGRVDELVARSTNAVHPPASWKLATAEQVNALRQEMDVKRILDDLKAGGATANVMWLASCGSEIGAAEDGTPQLAVLVLSVTAETNNLVTLRVAAGQEAADAKTANMEIKVESPPEAARLKAEDVVRVSGTISDYRNEPEFLLMLTKGKVNAEDIPKTR
jgi:hypothetical protein